MTQFEKMEKILENEEIQAKISSTTDPEEAYQILKENGLDVSREVFDELLVSLGEAVNEQLGEDELGEADLENVSGGSLKIVVGKLTIKMTTAAAAAFGTGFAVGVGIGVAVGLGYLAYRTYKKNKKR